MRTGGLVVATEPNGNQAAAPIAFSDNGLGPEGRFGLRVSGLPQGAIVAVIARRMRASGLWRAVRREAASAGPMRGPGGFGSFLKKTNTWRLVASGMSAVARQTHA